MQVSVVVPARDGAHTMGGEASEALPTRFVLVERVERPRGVLNVWVFTPASQVDRAVPGGE